MCNPLGYEILLSVLYIYKYSNLIVAFYYSIFVLSHRSYFAIFKLHFSKSFFPLLLNYLADFFLSCYFFASTQALFVQLFPYF